VVRSADGAPSAHVNQANESQGADAQASGESPSTQRFGPASLLNDRLRVFAALKRRTRPLTFFVTPTLACPLGCVYCFEEGARARDAVRGPRLVDNVETV